MSVIKKFLPYLWIQGLRWRIIAATILLFVAKGFNVLVPLFYKKIVDHFSEHALLMLPISILFAYSGARIAASLFGEIRNSLFSHVAQHTKRSVALLVFQHVHRLSLRFHLERYTGGLSRVIELGTRGIEFILSFLLFEIVPTIIEFVIVICLLSWYFDLRYSVIIFFTIFSYVFYTLKITNWRAKIRREMVQKDTHASSKAVDSLLNFETVKYFNNEEHEFKRYDSSLAGYEKAAIRSQTSLSVLNFGQVAIISIGTFALMWAAADQVKDKILTLGDFIMINTYLLQLYAPLNFLGFIFRELKQSLIDMEKMFELLDVNQEIKDKEGALEIKNPEGDIVFDQVHFSYQKEREILKGISFTIKKGQSFAVVGTSGAGKSTLARLLFRFYDPTKGKITIGGENIQTVTQKSLRKNIGVVPQDTVLFNDTIYYNIAYGKTDASEQEVKSAAYAAQISGFIESLPEGYQTTVGERGLKLSGGEKQRVAIARTILKNPPILILDEATSALDTKTEEEIQKSLNEIAKNRTALIIAHRLSTVAHCDQIIVLDQGKIAEQGTHLELLDKKGTYFSMWERQKKSNEIT